MRHDRRRQCAVSAALVTLAAAHVGCNVVSKARRSPEELQAGREAGVAIVEQTKRDVDEALSRRVHTEVEAAMQDGDRAVYDVLVLSGGGDYGAFGAGVLAGWGEITDPARTRPTFDFVTGVSTGALIAPYAFVGTDEAIDFVLSMYQNPGDDWLRERSLLRILLRQDSIYNIDGLKRTVREKVTSDLADQIASGVADDRVLLAGATNLEYGVFVVFDLGAEFAAATEAGDLTRPVDIMLASSAIPGGFPPVEIDGELFVDGGAGVQMFLPDHRSEMYRRPHWAQELYADHKPKFRVWAIVNNKLSVAPANVQPSIPAVLGRSLGISIRTSATLTLRDLETLALLYNETGADIEFRYLAVPESFQDNPGGKFFDKDTMSRLGELGRQLGRDPDSWRRHVPSPEWPSELFRGFGDRTPEQLRELTEQDVLTPPTRGGQND